MTEIVSPKLSKGTSKQDFCTASVISFLQENRYLINEYFEDCQKHGSRPTYSNFLHIVSGTTKEKVNLASSYVLRGVISDWLFGEYVDWLIS